MPHEYQDLSFPYYKIIFHKLGILFAVLVQNMSIYLCYHVCLRMTGIALYRLYITATQFQLSSFNSSPCLSLIMLKFLCASAQPYNMMENTYTAAHFSCGIVNLATFSPSCLSSEHFILHLVCSCLFTW